MNGESLSYCSCNTCSGRIEFDASLFQTGNIVVCPHCGIETALHIQKNNLSPISLAPERLIQVPSHEQLQRIDSLVIIGGTDCPNCKSTNTQRLEMTFAMGITQKRGTLIGMDLQGDVGVGSLGGTSQTALSIANRPPEKKSVQNIYLGGLLLGFLIFAIFGCLVNFYLGLVLFIGFMIFIYKFAAPTRKYNAQIYPKLVNRWLDGWICLRCGSRWIPEK
jgi:hypothetical protein